MFADAKVSNNKQLNIQNILNGINSCDRIEDETKQNVCKQLKLSLYILPFIS